uniref:Large ribosomal subunit protein bL36c n=1 Tax=Chromera velia TaxID=505693 RepID=D9IXK1_9ALVE|nr:ribosomal protein L36 [Chromera velia]ADJ66529.1 ribosomal protein L36 [Chromera velia]
MKVLRSIRPFCENCILVKRKKYLRIVCVVGKHKQRQK